KPEARIEIDRDSPQIARALMLRVPVAGLECGNDKMNDKLREALDAEKHPAIDYHLIRAEQVAGDPAHLKATGALTIAGKTRTVTFLVEVDTSPDGATHAKGTVPILMTSFGVEPPTALLVLKTYDKVVV